MPKYHLIKTGASPSNIIPVENTIEAASVPTQANYPGYDIILAVVGAPGWLWNGSVLTPPTITEAVPFEISRLQFATGLWAVGKLSAAEASNFAAGNSIPAAFTTLINALPTDQQVPATIRINGMTRIVRSDAMLALFMANSNPVIASAQMDAWFIAWSKF